MPASLVQIGSRILFLGGGLVQVGGGGGSGGLLNLAWSAPLYNSDGTLITDPITYNLYQAPGNATDGSTAPLSLVQSGITTNSVAINDVSPGVLYYFAVSAVVDGVEGPMSTDVYMTP